MNLWVYWIYEFSWIFAAAAGSNKPVTDNAVLIPMLSEVLLEVISPLIMSMFVGKSLVI